MLKTISIFFLVVSCLLFTHCQPESVPIEVKEPEPLPPSSFSITIENDTYESPIDSASLTTISSTQEVMTVSFKKDSISVTFLLQQGPGIVFSPGDHSFTHATVCQMEVGLCANIVVSTSFSNGIVTGKASRFEGNTLNLDLEIADVKKGGQVKGSFSAQISDFDNRPQQNISGNFDLYLERE